MYAVKDHDYHYLIYRKEVVISKERLTRKVQDDKKCLCFLNFAYAIHRPYLGLTINHKGLFVTFIKLC